MFFLFHSVILPCFVDVTDTISHFRGPSFSTRCNLVLKIPVLHFRSTQSRQRAVHGNHRFVVGEENCAELRIAFPTNQIILFSDVKHDCDLWHSNVRYFASSHRRRHRTEMKSAYSPRYVQHFETHAVSSVRLQKVLAWRRNIRGDLRRLRV